MPPAGVTSGPLGNKFRTECASSDDCTGLVEDAVERQVVITALDMIVDDQPLSKRRGRVEPARARDARRSTVDADCAICFVAADD